MTRRILTIVLAIALALIGTGAVLLYVSKANQRAIAGQRAVTVLVASQQIPAGTLASTAIQEGLLSRQRLPAASVPADALGSISPALDSLVFSSALPAGQLLLRPILVTALQTGATMPIPAGKVAVSISMCVQKAVAGYISPGAQIAVFNTFFTGQAVQASCSGIDWSKQSNIHTRLVLNDVPVLAVGQPSPSSAGSGATSAAYDPAGGTASSASGQTAVLVTVAVNQADAERLIELAEAHIPYLALVTSSSGTHPDVVFAP